MEALTLEGEAAAKDNKPPERILCVDDERNILNGIKRNLGRELHIVTALGPEEGLEAIASSGPFGVIMTDMQMPGMDGAAFLAKARRRLPHAIRILLTGQASAEAAQRAINRGGVHKYVTKPCPPERLRKLFRLSIEEHRRVVAEQRILEQTVQGSVEMLTEVLALLRPTALGRAVRMRHYLEHICTTLEVPGRWRYVTAAMLSQVGSVLLPQDLIVRAHAGDKLTKEEAKLIREQRSTAQRLISKVPRLEDVAAMVAGDAGADGEDVATGIELLARAEARDEQVIREGSIAGGVGRVRQSKKFSDKYVDALRGMPPISELTLTRLVRAEELTAGMTVDQDVVNTNGVLLVSANQRLDGTLAMRVASTAKTVGVVEPIRVRFHVDCTHAQ